MTGQSAVAMDADVIAVETLSGLVRPQWAGEGQVKVDMGLPILTPEKIPTTLATGAGPVLDVPIDLPDDVDWPGSGQTLRASSISMGNPHCVIQVDDIDSQACRTPCETGKNEHTCRVLGSRRPTGTTFNR